MNLAEMKRIVREHDRGAYDAISDAYFEAYRVGFVDALKFAIPIIERNEAK